MTANKKDKIILVDKGVLTEDALLAYLHNVLSAEERLEVEKILQDDVFAREAMDGMLAATSKTEASSALLSINQKIRNRVEGKHKGAKLIQLHWTNFAWAAAIFGLIFCLGYILVLYYDNRPDSIAMKQSSTEQELISAPVEVATKDTATVAQEQESKAPAEVSAPEAVATKLPNSEAQGAASSKNSSTAEKVEPPTKVLPLLPLQGNQAREGLAKEKQVTASDDKFKTENGGGANSMALSKSVEDRAGENESLNQVTVESAMKSFNSGDYKTASAQFDILLKQQANQPDALYFGGISDYINGDIKKSEKSFDVLLKDGTRFSEGSKWYKANILLKKGKKDEAKKLLQDLSVTGGSYKERASKKLGELE
ncbi:MAG: hypothetical protein IPP77_15755 [Bacteroidetes bacterium]|nr:hypothetical protein [Bacteroidota bacterium]